MMVLRRKGRDHLSEFKDWCGAKHSSFWDSLAPFGRRILISKTLLKLETWRGESVTFHCCDEIAHNRNLMNKCFIWAYI